MADPTAQDALPEPTNGHIPPQDIEMGDPTPQIAVKQETSYPPPTNPYDPSTLATPTPTNLSSFDQNTLAQPPPPSSAAAAAASLLTQQQAAGARTTTPGATRASTPSAVGSLPPSAIIPPAQVHGSATRVYINSRVTPALLEGMKWVAANEPEKPLQWLGEYLLRKSAEVEGA